MMRFLRHGSGVQWENNVAPGDVSVQGPDAPLAHRRPGYSLPGCTPRSRAGLRLHPEVRHGALRRRWCEWEQPHTLSWRSALADDAEWMSGKSRTRLAPVLTSIPSWMS